MSAGKCMNICIGAKILIQILLKTLLLFSHVSFLIFTLWSTPDNKSEAAFHEGQSRALPRVRLGGTHGSYGMALVISKHHLQKAMTCFLRCCNSFRYDWHPGF